VKITLLVRCDETNKPPALEMELVEKKEYTISGSEYSNITFLLKNHFTKRNFLIELVLHKNNIEEISFSSTTEHEVEKLLSSKKDYSLLPTEEKDLRDTISKLFFQILIKSKLKASDLWCCQPSPEFYPLIPTYFQFVRILEVKEDIEKILERF